MAWGLTLSLVEVPGTWELIQSWIDRNVEDLAATRGIFGILVVLGAVFLFIMLTRRR